MAEKRPVGRPNVKIHELSEERLRIIEKRIQQEAAQKRKKLIEAARVGIEVRNRRIALGLTLEKLAHQAGVVQNSVFNLEKGIPTPKVLPKVLKALDKLEAKKRGAKKAPRKK